MRIKTLLLIVLFGLAARQGSCQANDQLDSLKKIVAENNRDTNQVRALTNLGAMVEYSDTSLAVKCYKDAFSIAEKLEDRIGMSDALILQGWILEDRGKYIDAEVQYNKALKLAQLNGNALRIASCYNNLGLNAENRGLYNLSISYHKKALAIREKTGNKLAMAGSYNNLANAYGSKGIDDSAQIYFLKALGIYESVGNKSRSATCYNNIAIIMKHEKLYETSAEYYLKAVNIWRTLKDDHQTALALFNLGNLYTDLKQYEKAGSCLEESLGIRIESDDLSGQAMCYNSLARIALNNPGKLEQGKNYVLKALAICDSIHSPMLSITTHQNMAEYAIKTKNFSEATAQLDIAEKEARLSEMNHYLLNIFEQRSELFEEKGNLDVALFWQRRSSEIRDSVNSDESRKLITELNTRYESERREKDIITLNNENQLTQAQIATEKKAKKFLLGIIALVVALACGSLFAYRTKQRANRLLSLQKSEIHKQKLIVDEKNKEITDSITYAKRIQGALLASVGLLQKNLPDHFVLYKPKDIVSGDFYWGAEISNGKFLLLTGDCTGHGVPGAFMSLLNISLLNEIVIEHRIERPDDILNEIRRDIIHALNPDGAIERSWDGMDCSLISFDFPKMKMTFACANNPIWLWRNGDIIEFRPDKFPVGQYEGNPGSFQIQSSDLQTGDIVYTFTDGFADQFGGEKGKKFKYLQLKEKLIANSNLNLEEQKKQLEKTFNDWKGNLEQVDDVLVIGIKIG